MADIYFSSNFVSQVRNFPDIFLNNDTSSNVAYELQKVESVFVFTLKGKREHNTNNM